MERSGVSFRRPKSNRHVEDRAWRAWFARHEAALKEAGLPPSVTMSEAHWVDFLQNGYLEWHPESCDGFTFDRLSSEQMGRLLRVLEVSPAYATAPMAGWIRVGWGARAACETGPAALWWNLPLLTVEHLRWGRGYTSFSLTTWSVSMTPRGQLRAWMWRCRRRMLFGITGVG
jgi:hypothetical protein